MIAILGIVVLLMFSLMLVGAVPTRRYSKSWNDYPCVGLGLLLVILVILYLASRI
jgi:hypothetical protein